MHVLTYIFYFTCLVHIIVCEVQVSGQTLPSHVVEARIKDLRNFMLGNNDLKKMRTDDSFLLRFLHVTDFKMKNAQKMVEKYYKFVKEETGWVAVNLNDKMKYLVNMDVVAMLPAVDRYGKKLLYLKFDTMDTSKMTLSNLCQLETIWLEDVLDDPKVQKNGISLLVDAYQVPLGLLGWLTPTNVGKYMRHLDNIVAKNVTVYLVRSSPIIYTAVQIAWPFMPTFIREKIRFYYDDLDTVFEHISPDNLPKQCGGNLVVDFASLNSQLLSRSSAIEKKLHQYKVITGS